MIRLTVAAGIDQLANRSFSQSRALSKLANFSHHMLRFFFLATIGRNQFCNWNPPPRNPDRLALGNPFQQAIEMGFGVKDSDGSLMSHPN